MIRADYNRAYQILMATTESNGGAGYVDYIDELNNLTYKTAEVGKMVYLYNILNSYWSNSVGFLSLDYQLDTKYIQVGYLRRTYYVIDCKEDRVYLQDDNGDKYELFKYDSGENLVDEEDATYEKVFDSIDMYKTENSASTDYPKQFFTK